MQRAETHHGSGASQATLRPQKFDDPPRPRWGIKHWINQQRDHEVLQCRFRCHATTPQRPLVEFGKGQHGSLPGCGDCAGASGVVLGVGVLGQQYGLNCAAYFRNEQRQYGAGWSPNGQIIEIAPRRRRCCHVVIGFQIGLLEASWRRRTIVRNFITQRHIALDSLGDRRRQQIGINAIKRIPGVGIVTDDIHRWQKFADRAQKRRLTHAAIAVVAACIEINRRQQIQIPFARQLRQLQHRRTSAIRGFFLVGRGDKQQVAVAFGLAGKVQQHRQTRRQTAFHIQRATPRQVIARKQILQSFLVGGAVGVGGEFRDQPWQQRFRITRPRLQVAIIGNADDIKMPDQHHRCRATAAHQGIQIRAFVCVIGGAFNAQMRRISPKVRRGSQPIAQVKRQIAFARRVGHARPANELNREIAHGVKPECHRVGSFCSKKSRCAHYKRGWVMLVGDVLNVQTIIRLHWA